MALYLHSYIPLHGAHRYKFSFNFSVRVYPFHLLLTVVPDSLRHMKVINRGGRSRLPCLTYSRDLKYKQNVVEKPRRRKDSLDLNIDGRTILKQVSKHWDESCSRFKWQKIAIIDRLVWTLQKPSIRIKAHEVPDGLSSHILARQHSTRSAVLGCARVICFCKKRGSNMYTVKLIFVTKIQYSTAISLSWKVSCRFLSLCHVVT